MEIDIETPYEPTVVHYPRAGYWEFVMADVPVVVRDHSDGVSLLLDMKTRKPIGVRWWRPVPMCDCVEAHEWNCPAGPL